ncbi:hypothetical protein LK542_11500 [Massilia sp. IC2-477]|uniref:hypothetical protein n=1 Tax=Massilia sp. IC2-477 TaxID=2887198 RepID=UPI001D126AF7|nr:hypothetical protein [Massilia sp. IC2-477]MCC2956240.1 hypothetical protein [Massilia sp. IC2-477]
MKLRDAFGLLRIAASLSLGVTAWTVNAHAWAFVAVVLFVAGILLLWRREREDAIHDATADLHTEGLGSRIGSRRAQRGDDGDGIDIGDSGD